MPATKPKQQSSADPVAAIVDELGDLEKELSPMAPKIARVEALRKALRTSFATKAPELAFLAEGTRYVVAVGECGLERSINIPKLVKEIGMKFFIPIASVTLKRLEAGVAPDVVSRVVVSGRTGSRTLKVMERGK